MQFQKPVQISLQHLRLQPLCDQETPDRSICNQSELRVKLQKFSKDSDFSMRTFVILVISLFFISAVPIKGQAAEANQQIDPALELIQALGCKGCHTINKKGGTIAPDLTQIGSRMTVDQIHSHLIAHRDTRTKGFMPSYATLSENHLQLISQYLYNLH